MKKVLLALGVVVIAAVAFGARTFVAPFAVRGNFCNGNTVPKDTCTNYDVIDGGTDATTRTVTGLDVNGYSRMTVSPWLTDANTDCDTMVATVTVSNDNGTNYANYVSRAISAGVGTVSAFTDSTARATAINGAALIYDVWGYTHAKIVMSTTGTCAGNDAIDVRVAVTAGK